MFQPKALWFTASGGFLPLGSELMLDLFIPPQHLMNMPLQTDHVSDPPVCLPRCVGTSSCLYSSTAEKFTGGDRTNLLRKSTCSQLKTRFYTETQLFRTAWIDLLIHRNLPNVQRIFINLVFVSINSWEKEINQMQLVSTSTFGPSLAFPDVSVTVNQTPVWAAELFRCRKKVNLVQNTVIRVVTWAVVPSK